MPLRIVLFGTGDFALPTFRTLIESSEHSVVGVFTQPDRTGRGHHHHVNKVKVAAETCDVPVFQPEKVNHPETLDALRQLDADVFVVAAYGQILKPEFLAIPPLGAFNLHGSLLPRHRGAAPVQYSIRRGDQTGGVTIFQIEPALDSGPVIGRVETRIGPRETAGELMLRLADLSVELTQRALQQLEAGTAVFEPQDESLVTLAPKIRKSEGAIDWSLSAHEIDCHIRAMQPWPKASTWLHTADRRTLRCIVVDAEPATAPSTGHGLPGSILCPEKQLQVATGDGTLQVNVIQPEGKKPIDGLAFVNGYGIDDHARFDTA